MAIIGGALSYREMAVSEVMTPVREAFMMSASESLSYKVTINLVVIEAFVIYMLLLFTLKFVRVSYGFVI